MSTCENFIENKNIYGSVNMQVKLSGITFNSSFIFVCYIILFQSSIFSASFPQQCIAIDLHIFKL